MLSLFSNRIRKDILKKELLRLAENLYSIGLLGEADEITLLARSYSDTKCSEESEENYSSDNPVDSLEDLIRANADDDDFSYSIADILINHLNEDSLREISESISEAIE